MSSSEDGFLDPNASDDEVMAASGDSDFEDTPRLRTRTKANSKVAKSSKFTHLTQNPVTGKRKRAQVVASPIPPRHEQGERRGMFDDDDEENNGDEYDNDEEGPRQITGSEFLTKLLAWKTRPVKDLGGLELKADHTARPLWIDNHGRITLERFSPIAEQAQDFLVAIAEPVSRPTFIHEYRVNEYSLYAAMSVGLETKDIVEVLSRLSKTPLPQSLIRDIHRWTAAYGKVKLVLKRNRYFLESSVPEMIQRLLADPQIRACRITQVQGDDTSNLVHGVESAPKPTATGLLIPGTTEARRANALATGQNVEDAPAHETVDDVLGAVIGLDRADEMDEDDQVQSFEIDGDRMEKVKRQCQEIGLPVLEEYDFRADNINQNLEIDLKPMTVIRSYQETSLSKMFGNGRARSGIIVLPCGAGKTLVGITAACTIKKSVLVLCTSAVSAQQWKQAFIQFTNIQDKQISIFTSQSADMFSGADSGAAGIVISVYSMVAFTGKRSHSSETFMNFLKSREWGLLLLDEVHVAPATAFRKCVESLRTHAKLGLTATLVREDDRISDLNYIIGPKLYEANWMDLAQKGHIANVQCAEVWCPMTPEFYAEYLLAKSRARIVMQAMNPNKFQACQFLINYHERRGDKIIVFSDNVYSLMQYAQKLGKAAIHGGTDERERMRILARFQHDPNMNTIFLSKVGDTSIDLPEATCLIQISSHYGSRRQEAQRLGRILRAKRRNDEGFNAFFYSLVSKDTSEMYYSTKRQGFLVDQGYAFKIITELHGIDLLPDLVFKTQKDQLELLGSVLNETEKVNIEMEDEEDAYDFIDNAAGKQRFGGGIKPANRMTGSMQNLAGGSMMTYQENSINMNRRIKRDDRAAAKSGKGARHEIFRKDKRPRQD